MMHPLIDLNFRPYTSLLKSGYTVNIELGDLAQHKQVWQDQVWRVTVTTPSAAVEWKVFRGSKCRVEAIKWLKTITAGVIDSI